ncbi:cilia- and flagella-associated protein 54 [Aplysia californica]|uniref:Cilia- and flagella-associated protein 54 n=1 Tax=Aplysia californica TaxID=6500 RepID=A0ABM1AEB6_APLCA|nr:cilia- and flagella-associated protein 54 [Aplysia californica]
MEVLGERIEHYHSDGQLDHLSSPQSPMQNVYLPHVQRLAQVKLRIGHAQARNTAKMVRNGKCPTDPVLLWVDCLGVLTTALEISQVSAAREASVEAEILLLMGKVQKMLVYQGKYQARSAAGTLLEAIKISFINDHDLGLMRQAYLEIALIYLYSSGLITVKDGSFLESVAGDSSDEVSVASSRTERKYKRSKEDVVPEESNLKRERSRVEREETEQEKERRCAWLAVRCATAVATAQRARGLLVGDTAVTSQRVGEKSTGEVPDFLGLDLLSGYVLGEKKKVYKNEIEEELASLIEAQEVKVSETYDDQVNKARVAAKELSWIHLLGYQSILQRLVSTATTSVSTQLTDRPGQEDGEGEDGGLSEMDLGFISHAQFDTGLNYDVVRYMLHSGLWCMRLTQMHGYLCNNLKVYAADCCAPYPPPGLHMTGQAQFPTDLNITIKSYASNLSLNSEIDAESLSDDPLSSARAPLPPGSQLDSYKPVDRVSASGQDTELSIQWYQPGLEESDPGRCEAIAADKRIVLLYAISRRTSAQSSPQLTPGFIWVSLHKVNDLHDRLALLSQRAEISLVEKVKKEPTTPSPTPAKSKKAQRIKALSPKVQRDEQLENLLRQCLDDACSLTGVIPEQGATSGTDFPFEVSKVNIKNLESMFDPSLGLTLKGSDLLPWLVKLFP